MRSMRGRLSAALAAGALVLAVAPVWLASPAPARATDITVTTTEDVIADDGECSLREAIIAANTNLAVDVCPAGQPDMPGGISDHITLPPGTYRLAIAGPDEDAAATGDLDILEALGIDGYFAAGDPRDTVIDGAGLDRVFDIQPSARAVALRSLTVTGGMTDGEGGGIRLVDLDSTGECSTSTDAELDTIVIRDNSARSGGGVAVGTCTYVASDFGLAIIDNQAADGGGIAMHEAGGLWIISGSVISGNVAAARGGGIFAAGWVSGGAPLSDIVGNRAETGGGVYAEVGEPDRLGFYQTILAANQGGNCWFGDGYPRDAVYTLSSDDSCGFSGEGNLASIDPLLFERDANPVGYRLQPGSPAIDAGDRSPEASSYCGIFYDVYGNRRPQDGDGDGLAICDIGMYEYPTAPSASGSPSVPNTAVPDSPPDRHAIVWLVSIGLLGLAVLHALGAIAGSAFGEYQAEKTSARPGRRADT